MTGIAQRTTTNMDDTVVDMDMDEKVVSVAISSTCSAEIDDVEYLFERSRSAQTTSTSTGGPICASGMTKSTRLPRSMSPLET